MQRARETTLQQSSTSAASKPAPLRTTITNVDDLAFTGTLTVSGEDVHPIIDTGSFELVLFAKKCKGCSNTSKYFDYSNATSDYKETDLSATQSYGSGETHSTAVYANVKMTDSNNQVKVKKQVFWLANEVDMDFDVSGDFSGVFGLGPPASALSFAVSDLSYVQDAIASMEGTDTQSAGDLVDTLEQVVALENETYPWLYNADCKTFSVCIMPGFGQNGALILNDVVSSSQNWIPTNGEFWQVPISAVSIGSASFSSDSKCSAIIDSGTSLIGVPSDFMDTVSALIEELVNEKGCDDLSGWPTFAFSVGHHKMSLHPSSYVATYDMSSAEEPKSDNLVASHLDAVKLLMPHLERFRAIHDKKRDSASNHAVCAPALFAMDSTDGDSDGCLFLFGIPLFREYYTSFQADKDGQAESMMFSKADKNCVLNGNSSDFQVLHKPRSPLVVDPKKIRFPTRALSRKRRYASLETFRN